MNLKQIIFWCPFISKVGTINAVIESAKALKLSKKFQCKVINVFGEFDEYSHILSKNQIKEIKLTSFRFLKHTPKKGFFWSRFNYILIILLSSIPLYIYLKKNKKDILFTYLLTSLPLLLVKIFDLKNRIFLRMSGKINYTFLRKTVLLLTKNKIDKTFIQTKFAKKELLKQNIFEKKKISFLEDPIIDFKKINDLKKEKIEKKFKNKSFFVAIGRLTKQKNFEFLIDSIKEILLKNSYYLIILGEGEQKKLLQKKIKIHGLENKIFLLGFKNNVYKYLSKSKGLICTSLWEEPGFIIHEAAACKKIILSSNCKSGPSEFLGNGKSGYIFNLNDKKNFIDKFNQMIKEKNKHPRMIKDNYRKCQLYTKKYFADKLSKELSLIDNFS